jgi:ATP-dependent DNA helicase RecQ
LQGFDGTKIAQMALSACKRSNESIGINLLVEVLRGSGRKDIYDRHLHEIKTYGAGKDISFKDWMHYLTQLINQGYFEIDYTRHSILKCTPLSDAVLFDRKNVTLHRQVELPEEPIIQRQSKSMRVKENLLEHLESLRDRLAKEDGLPSFAVFPLGTLKEIAETRPYTVGEFSKLDGVGEFKSGKYGQEFVDAIRSFMGEQKIIKRPKGITYIETLDLFRQGMSLADIATKRGMAVSTIAAHLSKLYLQGEEINLQQFLLPGDLDMARQGWRASGFSEQTSKVKEQVGDSLDYGRLNFALAILKREKLTEGNISNDAERDN